MLESVFIFNPISRESPLYESNGRNKITGGGRSYSCHLFSTPLQIVESDGNNEIPVIPGVFLDEFAELPSYFHFTSDTYRSAKTHLKRLNRH